MTLIGVVALASGLPLFALNAGAQETLAQAGPADGGMMQGCRMMMEKYQSMQGEMAAMDARIDKLVADMNAASGDAKLQAMAALLTEIVGQRKAMRSTMMEMQPGMMQHMMGHMGAGFGPMDSMKACPMMKAMMGDAGGAGTIGGGGHSEHH